MVMALHSLNSSTASLSGQLSLYKTQLQQARRVANQAENRVAQLEQQTQTARNEAVRAHGRVRQVEGNPPQTESSASRGPIESLDPTINTLGQLNGRLLNVRA